MNIGNIKNQRLAILEQACERYATMAFETLNGRLAIGLKSITYSYVKEEENGGTFTASYTPWNVSDCPNRADRIVTVSWYVDVLPDGTYRLSEGMTAVQGEPGHHNILWAKDGSCMAFSLKGKTVGSLGAEQCRTFANSVQV